MFEFNDAFFKEYDAIYTDIKQFIQRGVTGQWDELMQTLTQFIAVVEAWIERKVDLYDPTQSTVLEASKTIVTSKRHQWIIKHQTAVIKDASAETPETR
jgi:hypothetical protein